MKQRTLYRVMHKYDVLAFRCSPWLSSLLLSLLLILTSCSSPSPSSSSHAAGTPQASSGCSVPGKTHVASALANTPSAQGSWPLFHGDLSRDGAGVGGNGTGLLTLAWTYCTGGPIFSSPIAQNGIVYTASTDKTLSALDIRTGNMVWRFRGESPFYSTPALQDGVLYAAGIDGFLYALDAATGRMRWQSKLGTPGARLWSSPAVAAGLVLIGLASPLNEQPKIAGQLEAFDTQTGKLRWQVWTLANDAPGGGIWSSPALDLLHSVVYVATGDPDDGVQALRLQDGHLLWHWRSVVQDVADTDIGAGPILYHDQQGKLRVVAGGKDGFLYSLDAQTGQVIWREQVGNQVFSSPAFAQGTLYAVGSVGRSAVSRALSAQTGVTNWQHPIAAIVYASPALAGQTLYLALGDAFGAGVGGIEVVNARNGQLLQFANVHSPTSSSPAVLAGWLFVGAQNGNLYAFTR
ncbi:MAG TPA: PQQ-binding-like beta-propeller repeat protein [Ktedonobacteraceae bacterium]